MKQMKNGGSKGIVGKIVPLSDRVLLKELDEKESGRKTDSGIYIPDTVKEDKGAKKAKVIAVGEGRYDDGKLVPMKVRPGDMVLYSWGDTITIDGEEYVLARESDISAIIK
jgi:chaperonin GroES